MKNRYFESVILDAYEYSYDFKKLITGAEEPIKSNLLNVCSYIYSRGRQQMEGECATIIMDLCIKQDLTLREREIARNAFLSGAEIVLTKLLEQMPKP